MSVSICGDVSITLSNNKQRSLTFLLFDIVSICTLHLVSLHSGVTTDHHLCVCIV